MSYLFCTLTHSISLTFTQYQDINVASIIMLVPSKASKEDNSDIRIILNDCPSEFTRLNRDQFQSTP